MSSCTHNWICKFLVSKETYFLFPFSFPLNYNFNIITARPILKLEVISKVNIRGNLLLDTFTTNYTHLPLYIKQITLQLPLYFVKCFPVVAQFDQLMI